MRRVLPLVVLLAWLLPLFGCGGGGGGNVSGTTDTTPPTLKVPTQAAAVQGTVIDPQTHAPLAGVTVNAYVQSDGLAAKMVTLAVATATTDANGFYSIAGLILGSTYYFEFVSEDVVLFTYYNIIPTEDVLVLETVNPAAVALAQTAQSAAR